jgi:hypothetical protein
MQICCSLRLVRTNLQTEGLLVTTCAYKAAKEQMTQRHFYTIWNQRLRLTTSIVSQLFHLPLRSSLVANFWTQFEFQNFK